LGKGIGVPLKCKHKPPDLVTEGGIVMALGTSTGVPFLAFEPKKCKKRETDLDLGLKVSSSF